MDFESILDTGRMMLAEGSVYELLRRDPSIEYDAFLAHGALVHDPHAASVLRNIHEAYLAIGHRRRLPMVALTDTWRASVERISKSKYAGCDINADCANFLLDIRSQYNGGTPIFVGGLTGCRGDAYDPSVALTAGASRVFHRPQIQSLASAGVDFLLAATLPALSEAQGIAFAMAETHLPYLLSFVISRKGTLLDGTPLHHAIDELDTSVSRPPTRYCFNCVHPAVVCNGLEQSLRHNPAILGRIAGLQANGSRKRPDELDGLADLETEAPETLADAMWEVYERFGLQILGGCCGTDPTHIECLADRMSKQL